MSKQEAIEQIKSLAKDHNLFVFVTDRESVEEFNDKSITHSDWERSIKFMNEFGDYSNILEALGYKE